MRQELTESNTFSIPLRQATSRDQSPTVTYMPASVTSERASYAPASYGAAPAFSSSRPLQVVPSPLSKEQGKSQAPSGFGLEAFGPSLTLVRTDE